MSSSTSELCQLPHISAPEAKLLLSRGVTSIHQLQQLSPETARQLAVECLCKSSEKNVSAQSGAQGQNGRGKRGGRGANSGNNGTEHENSAKISEFMRVLGDLPVCEITSVRVRAVSVGLLQVRSVLCFLYIVVHYAIIDIDSFVVYFCSNILTTGVRRLGLRVRPHHRCSPSLLDRHSRSLLRAGGNPFCSAHAQ